MTGFSMNKIRFRYQKTGKAKYISHLDLMSTMQRAFLRAGIKLKYSEGFNPHPYMSAALPLFVGCESLCELMDVGIVSKDLPDQYGHLLPEGLKITEAYIPVRKFNDIKWIGINCRLHYFDRPSDEIAGMLIDLFNKTSLVIPKKTKSGTSVIDIARFICDVKVSSGDAVEITAKISAQNPTINQNDILNVLGSGGSILTPDDIEVKRIEIYDADMLLFK